MADEINVQAYVQHLQALLPRGRAWTRAKSSRLTALLRSFASAVVALDVKALQTRIEILPSHTTDLITDWERTVGLPDDCADLATDLPGRRAAVIDKLVALPDLNPATFIALAQNYGLTISVDEHDQTRAGQIAGLDVSDGKWRYVWWITISADSSRYLSVLSDVSQSLLDFTVNPEFVCRLKKLSPSHTYLSLVTDLTANGLALAQSDLSLVLPVSLLGEEVVYLTSPLEAATGGARPYTYSVTSSASEVYFLRILPSRRLQIGFAASATPVDFDITYTVVDAEGSTATTTFTFTVNSS